MKIGVISDTHIPRSVAALPKKVFEVFKGVDLIIHAGDIVEASVLKELEEIAPVEAVQGNRDLESITTLLPETKILELKGFKIGIIHGHGEKGTTLSRLPSFFAGLHLDCIIFGHSHIPYKEVINETLYFNPGSATVKKRQRYPSVGILTLGSSIEAEIVYIIESKK